MIVGALSAVMGLLYALMQSDLKRLLAYSTVENLGVIYVCLGLALSFLANGLPAGASLALTAGLLHALNHSLFKGLLFMGAGAVLHGTGGERNLEAMGGLIHRLPVTSLCFLIGAAAISALPPLNGFVSEWLLFQAILAEHRPAARLPALPGAGRRRASWPWRQRWPPPASCAPTASHSWAGPAARRPGPRTRSRARRRSRWSSPPCSAACSASSPAPSST